MARHKSDLHGENEHLETNDEFKSRLWTQMDKDSWAGRDTVGAEFPERSIVHERSEPDGPPHVYDWSDRTKGY